MNLFPMEGRWRNQRGAELALRIRRCGIADLDAILALQEAVRRALPADRLFVRETKAELEESLALDFCLGGYAAERLMVFTLMIVNRATPRNLGWALGYDVPRLLQSVTYDSTFVSPDCRGFGLQRALLPLKDAEARSLGACEALATVAPENTHSLNNLLFCGFEILGQRQMYGGLDRFIVRKRLGKE